MITGIVDGPRTGGTPKAVELFATCDVADLAAYSLARAVNGGAAFSQSFPFSSAAATAGSFLYVSYETTEFEAFFGFAPHATSTALYVNGDDVIQLHFEGVLVDVYGPLGTDGTGREWEYSDGWAYRQHSTAAAASWSPSRWTFSGAGALSAGCETHSAAGCSAPFPLASYQARSPPPPPILSPSPLLPSPAASITAPTSSPTSAPLASPPAANSAETPEVGSIGDAEYACGAPLARTARASVKFPAPQSIGLLGAQCSYVGVAE
uniref:LTD domain-containing protein n=1 Tax=Haptolina ericina TaxID=156174 RepID=A0A7S3F3U1_9EUKA